VKNWVKELKKMLGSEIVLAIVGNKIDLIKERNVTQESAELYAESVGAKHFETSAKLNEGVEELFLELTNQVSATFKCYI
jgi:Ras-related protein Rab-21